MKRIHIAWLCGWLLACTIGTVAAEDVRKTAEAGMLVTGSIEVNPDGSFHGYTLDQPEKLPPVVVSVIGQTLPTWKFDLSNAAAAVVTTRMSLRVVAKPIGEGNFQVGVQGATFGGRDAQNGPREDVVHSKQMEQPHYPQAAIAARVSGTAYLVLRIGRDGTVQEVIAEQVNLDQYGTQPEMKRYRQWLADASLDVARHWTFNVPSRGSQVNDPFWVIRVPVNFSLGTMGTRPAETPYGSWHAYIPGPRETPPWISKTLANESPDALPDGAVGGGDARLRLVTPLSGA